MAAAVRSEDVTGPEGQRVRLLLLSHPARRNAVDPAALARITLECERATADGIRVDAGYRSGDTVTPNYDSLLAKLIVHAATREAAIERLQQAVAGFVVEGVKTNLPLHARIAASPGFAAGALDTHFLTRL